MSLGMKYRNIRKDWKYERGKGESVKRNNILYKCVINKRKCLYMINERLISLNVHYKTYIYYKYKCI